MRRGLRSSTVARSSTAFPPDLNSIATRNTKESVHELGHTLNLTHCDDYRCAMASSHAVEWIDLKESTLCAPAAPRLTPVTAVPLTPLIV